MKHQEITGHIAALFTILIWGLTFISTKILLRDFTPLEILFMRFAIGWLALWLLCPHWLAIKNFKEEVLFAGAGLSGVTLYFLLENMALTYTFASNVGVIVAVSPFFTAILAWILRTGERPGLAFFIGFALSMGGILLMTQNGVNFALNPAGDLLALLAAIAWAIYSILVRKLSLAGHGSLQTTRRIFFYGLFFMLPLVLLDGFTFNWDVVMQPQNILNLLFLGVGASAICFATWTFTVGILGAVAATMYIYLVPVITMLAAFMILGEPLTPIAICGICLTLAGLILAQRK